MPYISRERREDLWRGWSGMKNAGELNYELTLTIIEYLDRRGISYQTMNDIIGALEGCKIEFYRRMISPYENQKIKENGDVYE